MLLGLTPKQVLCQPSRSDPKAAAGPFSGARCMHGVPAPARSGAPGSRMRQGIAAAGRGGSAAVRGPSPARIWHVTCFYSVGCEYRQDFVTGVWGSRCSRQPRWRTTCRRSGRWKPWQDPQAALQLPALTDRAAVRGRSDRSAPAAAALQPARQTRRRTGRSHARPHPGRAALPRHAFMAHLCARARRRHFARHHRRARHRGGQRVDRPGRAGRAARCLDASPGIYG